MPSFGGIWQDMTISMFDKGAATSLYCFYSTFSSQPGRYLTTDIETATCYWCCVEFKNTESQTSSRNISIAPI